MAEIGGAKQQPQQSPEALQAAFMQGVTHYQQGKLAEAERIFAEVLQLWPDHFDALHLSGIIALQGGRLGRGAELIQLAIGINGGVAGAHSNLGFALRSLGRFEESLASCDRAIALKPDNADFHLNRASALQGLQRYREALASCDRALALKPNFAAAHCNRGNALRELKQPSEALLSYDRAIAAEPALIEAHCNRGNALLDLNRHDEAMASYERALALNPHYAMAHYNRGNALLAMRRLEAAVASYDRAIALVPDHAEAHDNRGNALRELQRPEEALASFDRAIALRPDYSAAHSNRGNALLDLMRTEEALTSFDRAIALRPEHPEAHWNRSLGLLLMGRLDEGFRQYEWRKRREAPVGLRAYPQPEWLGGGEISGKTLFLHWEQGFGDTIQFCRYAKLVQARGAKVVMSVQQDLRGLMARLDPAIAVIGPHGAPPQFDWHCPLLSLPLACRTTLATVPAASPYLSANGELTSLWSSRLPARTKPRIGLVWRGSAANEKGHHRSMNLTDMLPMLGADADWFCLQKELTEQDAALLARDRRIAWFGDALRDFDDTAALVELMDVVVSVDTGVAHLAGAMGKPVWILLPFNADWRWLCERSDSPWYPSARLFRQPRLGDWADAIARVADALRSRAGGG